MPPLPRLPLPPLPPSLLSHSLSISPLPSLVVSLDVSQTCTGVAYCLLPPSPTLPYPALPKNLPLNLGPALPRLTSRVSAAGEPSRRRSNDPLLLHYLNALCAHLELSGFVEDPKKADDLVTPELRELTRSYTGGDYTALPPASAGLMSATSFAGPFFVVGMPEQRSGRGGDALPRKAVASLVQ